MEDSYMDMINGPEITAQKRAIENAIEEVEKRHIEFFKSQPPMFEEDEYLKFKRCFTAIPMGQAKIGSGSFRRDYNYTIEKSYNIPQHIIDDAVKSISEALKPFSR